MVRVAGMSAVVLKKSGMRKVFFSLMLAVCGLLPALAAAQNESGGTDAGSCALHDHIYTCDGAAFQPILAKANTVAVDVHNADGVARNQLTALLTKKLGKTIAANGGPSDLIFLLIPTESGVVYGHEDAPLGTLRVYSVTPDGAPGHLLWAEAFSGSPDLPWPAVVHGLIAQFQSHLKIR